MIESEWENEYRFKELLLKKLDKIINLLSLINKEEIKMSAQLDALVLEVQNTEEDSAIALLEGLSAQITALAAELAADGIDNQKLVDLGAELDAKTAALAAAVSTTTPPVLLA
jgi:hypothetical protein